MQNRRTIVSTKSSIDAAALQADMARKYRLPGCVTRVVGVATSSTIGRRNPIQNLVPSLPSSSTSQTVCESCGVKNFHRDHICGSCGYFRSAQYQHATKSLAEVRGLVQAPLKIEVMIDSEWDIVEAKLAGISAIRDCNACSWVY